MGGFSLVHLLILAVVAVLLLGGGRFSAMMGDVAKGVKNFKKGMSEEDEAQAAQAQQQARLRAQPPLEPSADRDLRPVGEDRPRA